MVTGEPIPAEKAAGDRVTGGTVNAHRHADVHAPSGSARDTLLAQIVQNGRRGAAQPRADSAAGGSHRRVLRARGGRWWRCSRFVAWSIWGPTAAAGVRAGERRGGADHRLPLRARPGDADGDHGRHRARRVGRRPHQERRGARAARIGRHAGRRQDRDADRGQAIARHRDRGRRSARGRGAAAGRRARAGQRAPAGRGDSRRREGAIADAAAGRGLSARFRARASRDASTARASRSATPR